MAGDLDAEIAASQRERKDRVGVGEVGNFDSDIYGGAEKGGEGYATELVDEDDAAADVPEAAAGGASTTSQRRNQYSGPTMSAEEGPGADADPFAAHRQQTIAEREDEYHARRRARILSPARSDPFAAKGKPDKEGTRSYADVMTETALSNERADLMQAIKEKKEKEAEDAKQGGAAAAAEQPPKETRKRRRWDVGTDETPVPQKPAISEWDKPDAPGEASSSRWDATPTPAAATSTRRNRWDETPAPAAGGVEDTPTGVAGATPSGRKSRWDETPVGVDPSATPLANSGFAAAAATPVGAQDMATPMIHAGMDPAAAQSMRWERELDDRNRPLSDEELDAMFPQEGYIVLEPPATYQPIRTPARRLAATPTPMAGTPLYQLPTEDSGQTYDLPPTPGGNLPPLKQDDYQFFEKLLVEEDEEALDPEEAKKRKIMKLLLKIKNGTPPMRKTALRQITDKARELGAGPLFDQILPLLMSPALEDQERHLLVKVIDRILYKLDDLVRPYVHKILVVIEPLLIDEDYYARVEGREVISNLSKAAGLATMIATMRPDIDNLDEYVRNTTARAFAVVASALGIPALLPFLKAVCRSKKSWQARHTGVKISQQIAILMGCAVLPHLKNLVEIIEQGLQDEQQKVRTITALAIAALAEAATPYGIESFDSVLKPLCTGVRTHRGKGLAAFLKAIGYIIPLMDSEYANYYTREVMVVLIREFQSPDEEMKKIVLKVVKQCVGTDGVEPQYVRDELLDEFFRNFWVRRVAHNVGSKNKQLVETTLELATKVGGGEIVARIVEDLKDDSEPYRKMVMEAIDAIIGGLGAADVDARLEEQLIDGIMYAFQEQTTDDDWQQVMLNGFGCVVNALGTRVKPYLPQICGTIKWRLNNKSAKVRQQAADLISRIAVVMKNCGEEQLMGHLGVILYEYLGEEYPEVLGSILGALKAIVNVIGMAKMTPPIKDLLPRLAPILKNRHEKVQENSIDLVGRIADRGAEYVSAREWMRICFELLEMLKAHKKGIRRATVNTFGYIAKAIGPQDVLATLLNNLKVQERQNRVCTTVAIAIVAETCSPFTVSDSAYAALPSVRAGRQPSTRTAESALPHAWSKLNDSFLCVSATGPAGTDERVSYSGDERPERCAEVAFIPLRIHSRDGKGVCPARSCAASSSRCSAAPRCITLHWIVDRSPKTDTGSRIDSSWCFALASPCANVNCRTMCMR
jgi:splicing factor 3B subunit 1